MRIMLVGLVALGGCSTLDSVGKMSAAEVNWGEPIRQIITSDGKEGFVVSCDRGVEYCYERSRQVCGGNYEVIRRVDPDVKVGRTVEIFCKA
jgi:hypothetical protein